MLISQTQPFQFPAPNCPCVLDNPESGLGLASVSVKENLKLIIHCVRVVHYDIKRKSISSHKPPPPLSKFLHLRMILRPGGSVKVGMPEVSLTAITNPPLPYDTVPKLQLIPRPHHQSPHRFVTTIIIITTKQASKQASKQAQPYNYIYSCTIAFLPHSFPQFLPPFPSYPNYAATSTVRVTVQAHAQFHHAFASSITYSPSGGGGCKCRRVRVTIITSWV
ncbi:hypothetical protein HOY80DRAFT_701854 [Tuber brumale]|nr:hypothetical protein HOY80DRAFT_701854 [Tuber brumale]